METNIIIAGVLVLVLLIVAGVFIFRKKDNYIPVNEFRQPYFPDRMMYRYQPYIPDRIIYGRFDANNPYRGFSGPVAHIGHPQQEDHPVAHNLYGEIY